MSSNESVTETHNFYIDEPPINTDIETFFTKYASIPVSELREHLLTIRNRAWQNHNYPCLGRWGFLDFSIQQNPIYKEVVEKCKTEDATVIDFGCCLGQDVRQLIYDGVSPNQIRGYDLDPFFINQGYELFRDGELMKEKKIFSTGDIFDDQFLKTIEPADYVHVGSFIHLFDAETQKDVCKRLTHLSKHAIIGRQAGAVVAGEHPRATGSGKMMRHSPESFTHMWDEVTNGKWYVESATLTTTTIGAIINGKLTFVVRKRDEK
ncbi:unnamed protein product [Adineta steineri]|uniref:Methyltransferase domain-containing protein n=1 Tax=Adineta steineri TaxID=433720 RepID=A0A818ITR1_9BILA|nr:unnamed protein product [Adineta steineri]CAF1120847.1 unnamed protein product [Adineta steineri]CAF1225507.1 unnamed protein product [Adineta steineri]CAF3529732.1 unnamed protein product [Adineta steineri]CAF3939330.1 unnamed protein product [Adineta steineri]